MTAVLAGCLVWVLASCAWSADMSQTETRRTFSTPRSLPSALGHCAITATSVLVGLGLAGLVVPLVGSVEVHPSEILLDLLACQAGVAAWIWLHQAAPWGRWLASAWTTCGVLCVAAILMAASVFTF